MNVRQIINEENNRKELFKKIIDYCNNYNDYQKELLKLLLDLYFEDRKKYFIMNDVEAKFYIQEDKDNEVNMIY